MGRIWKSSKASK